MAKRVQRVRHDAAAAQAFLGKDGEITVDRSNSSIRVHDGINTGGVESSRADLNNVVTASSSTHGKMSAAQASNLAQALLDIITNAAAIISGDAVKTDKIIPSAAGNAATLDAIGNLTDSGKSFSSTDDVIDNFESGTSMLFIQAAAPVGWTKSITHNDKALRIVSGTGGGTGGTHDLSSPPSTAHVHSGPSHVHPLPLGADATRLYWDKNATSGSLVATSGVASTASATVSKLISEAGGTEDTGSSGPTAFAPAYVDSLICTKD